MAEAKKLSFEEYYKLRGLDEKIEKPATKTPGTPNVPYLCMCTPQGEIVYLKNMSYYCSKCGKESPIQSDFTKNPNFRNQHGF